MRFFAPSTTSPFAMLFTALALLQIVHAAVAGTQSAAEPDPKGIRKGDDGPAKAQCLQCFYEPTEEACRSQGKILVPYSCKKCGYCADPPKKPDGPHNRCIACKREPTEKECRSQGKVLVPQTCRKCGYCADRRRGGDDSDDKPCIQCFWEPSEEYCRNQGKRLERKTCHECGHCVGGEEER